MSTLTLARNAMATRFEMVLHGPDPTALRAAGEQAFEEIERLESQLSLYRATSEIFHLNARAAHEPVQVSPTLFALLERAFRLSAETDGAFDITIAPLVRCWGFMAGTGKLPSNDALAKAREICGFNFVQLNPINRTVRFARDGVMLDLGAIGKGYAIEQASEILREAGISSALVHGGTSTVMAIGTPPDSEAWKVAIAGPDSVPAPGAPKDNPAGPATVLLKDEALSVSAVWGRSFEVDGKKFGHVIDPRTGSPVVEGVLSAVVLQSPTETDALSTALLVGGPQVCNRLATQRPELKAMFVGESDGRTNVFTFRFPAEEC